MMETNYTEKLEELVEFGLADNSCVLFVGPEMIQFDGQDYNLAFYNSLPENEENRVDKKKVKYNAEEKIWSFTLKSIQRECYFEFAKFFKKNRNINNPIFHKLASIPFPLIVSLIPDDTISAAFSQYENFNFSFRSYWLDNDVPEPTRDNMLIYNIYGNIRNREYVASHFDYLNFILDAQKDFPQNLVTAIKKADYLIFVGFQFDKWYNVLLLYILDRIKSGTNIYAVEEQSPEELLKKLLDTKLKLLYIDKNGEQFINDLYLKSKDAGLLRKIMPKKEYLQNLILSNQKTIEKIHERLQVTADPMEIRKYELDLAHLEAENQDFIHQLTKLS